MLGERSEIGIGREDMRAREAAIDLTAGQSVSDVSEQVSAMSPAVAINRRAAAYWMPAFAGMTRSVGDSTDGRQMINFTHEHGSPYA
ncbi:MAG TPA: hypothetical protein VK577_22530 [Bradyrhizobium sp.]|jgi:hypothetical protein|nr:hypothetical protein [Bradyrhizobium sp.]